MNDAERVAEALEKNEIWIGTGHDKIHAGEVIRCLLREHGALMEVYRWAAACQEEDGLSENHRGRLLGLSIRNVRLLKKDSPHIKRGVNETMCEHESIRKCPEHGRCVISYADRKPRLRSSSVRKTGRKQRVLTSRRRAISDNACCAETEVVDGGDGA